MAREPVRKAVFHAQWISWDDAWKQGQSAGWSLELVATRLRKGLQGEKIPSIDEVITGPGTVETIDLSPEFWNTVYICVENILGDCVVWWPKRGSTLPGGVAQKSKHNIFLGREAIDAMWPIEQVTPVAPQGRKSRPGGRPPGPPPRHDWPTELGAYLITRVKVGPKITTDHKLADDFLKYCSEKFDWQPEQSAVRDKIPDLLKLIR